MATKIVKSLKFPNSTDTYQINAVALEGKSLTDIEAELPKSFCINVSSNTSGSYDCDKTKLEIINAYNQGCSVFINWTRADVNIVCPLTYIDIHYEPATGNHILRAKFAGCQRAQYEGTNYVAVLAAYMEIFSSPGISDNVACSIDISGGEYQLTTSNIITDINNKANKSTTLSGYGITNAYTKTEIDNMKLITVEDIDEICGTTIQDASNSANEVTF